jgi:acyl-CoA dehydrogenase
LPGAGRGWFPALGESHISSPARLILRDHEPAADVLPTQWLPRRMEAARAKFADALAEQAD